MLNDVGVPVGDGSFEADDDVLELLDSELGSATDGDTIFLPPNKSTPRDLAHALNVAEKDVQMTLIKKFKVMATLTQTIKSDVAEGVAAEFGKKNSMGGAGRA